MKPFDKRSVPGLEDCSSDSDSDCEISNKKSRYDDDVEIEIEVQNNEFLKEEPISNGNSQVPNKEYLKEEPISKCHLQHKRKNNVWRNVAQSEILDESIKKISVNKFNVNRSVESYSISKDYHKVKKSEQKSNKKNRRSDKRKLPVKERVVHRTIDKAKSKFHIDLNPQTQNPREIVEEIARILVEPKVELIERCYNVLGFDTCYDLLRLTMEIEESGGLLVLDGSRRRSPGGVFLNLIKESTDIDPNHIREIFLYNSINKNRPGQRLPQNSNRNYENNRRFLVNINLHSVPTIPINQVDQSVNITNNSPTINNGDEELEDGEIV